MTQSHVKLPFWPHNPHKTNARNVGKFFKIAHKLAQLGSCATTMESRLRLPTWYTTCHIPTTIWTYIYVCSTLTKANFGHINCPRQVHLLLEAPPSLCLASLAACHISWSWQTICHAKCDTIRGETDIFRIKNAKKSTISHTYWAEIQCDDYILLDARLSCRCCCRVAVSLVVVVVLSAEFYGPRLNALT